MPRTLPVVVDRASPVPLYHQLAEQWANAITDGTLKPGEPFENELALVARLRLSRPTVRRALDELVHQGLLVRRRGVGTHVASQVVRRHPTLTSLYEELSRSGRRPRTQVLTLQSSRPDRAVAQAMDLDADQPLVYLERLRFSEGRPLVILRSWLAPRFSDLSAEDLTNHGLYEVLARRGVTAAVARQRAAARIATSRERRLLDLPRTSAVLSVIWLSHDGQGEAIEYGEHSYRGDQYVLDNTLHSD